MYKIENGSTNLIGYHDGSLLSLDIDLKEKTISIKAIPCTYMLEDLSESLLKTMKYEKGKQDVYYSFLNVYKNVKIENIYYNSAFIINDTEISILEEKKDKYIKLDLVDDFCNILILEFTYENHELFFCDKITSEEYGKYVIACEEQNYSSEDYKKLV